MSGGAMSCHRINVNIKKKKNAFLDRTIIIITILFQIRFNFILNHCHGLLKGMLPTWPLD